MVCVPSGIMKRHLMLFMALMAAPVAFADTDTAEDTPATEAVSATPTVAEMLAEVEYLTKVKPKKKVSVYYILRSHSKCGFCRQITPDLIAAYKAMKGKGAEIILLSGDADVAEAEKWAKEAGMTKEELNGLLDSLWQDNKTGASKQGVGGEADD